MARTLAAFAASDAPLAERLAVVRELARAVADLHARGRSHGALGPDAVAVLPGGAVLLGEAAAGEAPLARAGFDAPEVARGGRPTRRSDAFSVGALAFLALAGRAPFEADEPLERVRRVLFAEPPPVRRHTPGVPAAVEGALAALLEKGARRRPAVGEVARLVAEELAAGERAGPVSGAPAPAGEPGGRRGGAEVRHERHEVRHPATPGPVRALGGRVARIPGPVRALGGRVARIPALASLSAPRRAGLAAMPVLALAVLLFPASPEDTLERDVAALVERGELVEARRRVEIAAKDRPGHPRIEKLRGDVACARGAPGECLRRYRVALAARPGLREDPVLRANARRLLGPEHGCGTRRAAAHLLGELRDPEALPALEAARRSAGLFAFFCTGDAIERAITATRAEARR